MPKKYSQEFKDQVVKEVIIDGKTIKFVKEKYNLGGGTINTWIRKYREESSQNKLDEDQELRSLRYRVEELQKENELLKKAKAFFTKKNQDASK